MLKYCLISVAIITINLNNLLEAVTYSYQANKDIIGEVTSTNVQRGESLGDIGRRYDVGVYEMVEANPGLNPWRPRVGAKVTIPTQFILPNAPRKGVILNLAEMRLYYFHPNKELVTTYPIGIGRKGWKTPLGLTKIIDKTVDPTWHPPASIRRYLAEKGKRLPSYIPPGPDNPLGKYAIRLAMPGYLIHGTNRPGGIGVRVTSGCIRLFPEDIEELYSMIPIGTQVNIIHQPYKLGWHDGQLYVEAHEPLSEPYYAADSLSDFKESLFKHLPSWNFDWYMVKAKLDQALGYPMLLLY